MYSKQINSQTMSSNEKKSNDIYIKPKVIDHLHYTRNERKISVYFCLSYAYSMATCVILYFHRNVV
jgi:hypothetical protein